MKGKKLSAFSLLAVSALILSGCSSSGDASGVKIEVPDIPMHESMGEF
jgi:putative spermidine/putrescine transport system substrate-binding protein